MTIRFGDIRQVAHLADENGVNEKPWRPCVVVSTDDQLAAGGMIFVIGISTLLPGTPPIDCVPMPHQAQGRTHTGLTSRCAAHPRWLVAVSREKVGRRLGQCRSTQMEPIVMMIRDRAKGP